MRKIGVITVATALTLVGVGGWLEWVTASSQARLAPAGDPINPTQMTMQAKNLPVAAFVDYSVQFPEHEH